MWEALGSIPSTAATATNNDDNNNNLGRSQGFKKNMAYKGGTITFTSDLFLENNVKKEDKV
jgi:hypothetical protein